MPPTAPYRHCMVVHAYYPLRETRVEREAIALLKQGYEIDVICLRDQDDPSFSVEEGVNVYRLPVRRRKGRGATGQLVEYLLFFLLAALKLTGLHFKRRYCAVQVHNLPDFLVFVALVPKIMGAKVILDIHDIMPEFYAVKFNVDMSNFFVRLVKLQERISCMFADRVITVTEPWRQKLIERGVTASKTFVVMNVADARFFYRQPQAESPEGDEYFKLIYHGILSPRYGIDLTVRAVAKLRHEIPALRFIIHGGGDIWRKELNALRALTEELHCQEHIIFSTQFVPTAELPALVRAADAGVVSYRRDVFTDGILPTKLMEYIALGLPVIAARSPVIDAYFNDTMLQLFEPENVDALAEAIATLYHSPQRRADLIAGSNEFNRQYSWAKVSAGYVEFVDLLCQRQR